MKEGKTIIIWSKEESEFFLDVCLNVALENPFRSMREIAAHAMKQMPARRRRILHEEFVTEFRLRPKLTALWRKRMSE